MTEMSCQLQEEYWHFIPDISFNGRNKTPIKQQLYTKVWHVIYLTHSIIIIKKKKILTNSKENSSLLSISITSCFDILSL